MIVSLYSYRDRKVGAYGFPFKTGEMQDNVVEGVIRLVQAGKFPDAKDYELYYVGTFDDKKCVFNFEEKPVMVLDLSSYVPKEKEA